MGLIRGSFTFTLINKPLLFDRPHRFLRSISPLPTERYSVSTLCFFNCIKILLMQFKKRRWYLWHNVVLQPADVLEDWRQQQHQWIWWKCFPSPAGEEWTYLHLHPRPLQVHFSPTVSHPGSLQHLRHSGHNPKLFLATWAIYSLFKEWHYWLVSRPGCHFGSWLFL